MLSLVPERRMGLPAKCTFCGEPHSGFCATIIKNVYPLPSGFPRNRSPLQGTHHFGGHHRRSGTSDGIAAPLRCRKLCHLQCARFAKRWRIASVLSVQPSALTSSPPNLQERLCRCASFGWAAPAPKEFSSSIRTLRISVLCTPRCFNERLYGLFRLICQAGRGGALWLSPGICGRARRPLRRDCR